VNLEMNLHKMFANSSVVVQLAAFQELVGSTQLVTALGGGGGGFFSGWLRWV
jgi:hypothetical protein